MAKWDIDRELPRMEPDSCPGTSIERIMVGVDLLKSTKTRAVYGNVRPTPEELAHGHVKMWCLGLGYSYMARAFFYDRTIRGAYLQARKAMKAKNLAAHTPWGRQDFTPSPKKAKKLDRRRSRSRTAKPEKRPDSP